MNFIANSLLKSISQIILEHITKLLTMANTKTKEAYYGRNGCILFTPLIIVGKICQIYFSKVRKGGILISSKKIGFCEEIKWQSAGYLSLPVGNSWLSTQLDGEVVETDKAHFISSVESASGKVFLQITGMWVQGCRKKTRLECGWYHVVGKVLEWHQKQKKGEEA